MTGTVESGRNAINRMTLETLGNMSVVAPQIFPSDHLASIMQPAFEIFYILALPDWAPNEVTPFQGFAPWLPYFMPLMEEIPRLPPDIIQPTLDAEVRLVRQRSGDAAWIWTPVILSTLLAKRKPLPIAAADRSLYRGDVSRRGDREDDCGLARRPLAAADPLELSPRRAGPQTFDLQP